MGVAILCDELLKFQFFDGFNYSRVLQDWQDFFVLTNTALSSLNKSHSLFSSHKVLIFNSGFLSAMRNKYVIAYNVVLTTTTKNYVLMLMFIFSNISIDLQVTRKAKKKGFPFEERAQKCATEKFQNDLSTQLLSENNQFYFFHSCVINSHKNVVFFISKDKFKKIGQFNHIFVNSLSNNLGLNLTIATRVICGT